MVRLSVGERRQILVEAAIRVVARDGVAAATTRAIVAEAGVSLASLHYAFASLDDLLSTAIEEVTERERLAAAQSLGPALPEVGGIADPLERLGVVLEGGLVAFVDQVSANPEWEQALVELALFAGRTGQHEARARQYEVYLRAAEDLLTAAAAAAGVRWTVPLRDAAGVVVMATDGLTLGWLATRDDQAALRTAHLTAGLLVGLAEPDPHPVPSPEPEEHGAH